MEEKRETLQEKLGRLFQTLKEQPFNEDTPKQFSVFLNELKAVKSYLGLKQYAWLFQQLSVLDNKKQEHAKKTILFCMKYSYKSFQKLEETPKDLPANILRTLPRLPVDWSLYKKFVLKILHYIQGQVIRYSASDQANIIHTLGAMAKVGILETDPRKLPFHLLEKLQLEDENLEQMDFSLLGVLWQFCVYAKKTLKDEYFCELLKRVDAVLSTKKHNPINPTGMQRSIFNLLQKSLYEEFTEGLAMEYMVGAYPLDIAILGLKVDLEVDGEQHYRDEDRLIRIHSFRDDVLHEYGAWVTIRIPVTEYAQLTTETHKIKSLERKFAEVGLKNIFKPMTPENTIKKIPKAPSKKNDDDKKGLPKTRPK